MAARALLLLVAAISCACKGQDGASKLPPPGATTSSVTTRAVPLEMRLGWVTGVTGSCLATANKALTPGSPIRVVSLGDKAAIVDGSVVAGTASDATCPPLMPD